VEITASCNERFGEIGYDSANYKNIKQMMDIDQKVKGCLWSMGFNNGFGNEPDIDKQIELSLKADDLVKNQSEEVKRLKSWIEEGENSTDIRERESFLKRSVREADKKHKEDEAKQKDVDFFGNGFRRVNFLSLGDLASKNDSGYIFDLGFVLWGRKKK
jgi:hypothetical protein